MLPDFRGLWGKVISLTFLPSEDVNAWPKYLRRKMERGEVAREDKEREV